MDFLASELIITPKGGVYHLDLRPEDIANKIILVGDQERVAIISNFFDNVTHKVQHREFVSHTGTYKGKKLSVISSGIGTDNIDIVINELDALVNIDLNTRKEKKEKSSLEIVRIGTCGILHDEIPIDSFILSTHALGIDNVGHFYKREVDAETLKLEKEIESKVKLPKYIKPYLTKASGDLNKRLDSAQVEKGITVTSSGFYAPQGRRLRLPLAEEGMLDSFTDFKHPKERFSNLEMESSALFALSTSLGHQATTICLGIANRRKKEFSNNYNTKIVELIEYVLERI